MTPPIKLIVAGIAAIGLAWPAHMILAREAVQPAAAQQLKPAAPLIARIKPGDRTLRSLLGDGFEIIHVDAPAGAGAARFILRKNLDIYSCEQTTYREGGGEGMVHVVSSPCLNLSVSP